ncbi:MAG TPA: hypothetical protein PLS56_02835, partial [Candidatus Dojkabacteria bacterium]|nr:hypothetical protein [Candidatus Dojkabacteria bacterium]
MLFNEKKYEFEMDGRKCSFETGKLALKSQSSILARMGDTVITVNVNTREATGDLDYFPLTVEYIEKFYASGKINGSRFVKRERFPSDDAILKARMIDRAVRPRFPHDYKDEVSVIVTVMSYDNENDPVLLAINAVSVALMNSKAPFEGPIGGVRIGIDDQGNTINVLKSMDLTSKEEKLNYVVAGDGKVFTMIDAGAYEVDEEKIFEGMEKSLGFMSQWIEVQKKFLELLEPKNKEYTSYSVGDEVVNAVLEILGDEKINENLKNGTNDKSVHEKTKQELYEKFEGKYSKVAIDEAYDNLQKKAMRKLV